MFPEPETATQTEPNATSSPTGCASGSLAVTLFVPESIRATTSAPHAPADQTAASSAASDPQGGYPIGAVATTLFVAGSTRTMLFPFVTATQTAQGDASTLMCSEQQARFEPRRIVATT